ncbi:MAG: ribulose-phosphate 3-epimerase [bacterium]|nr:ribulose-phosphate 3-epimerase [bacterium]
MHSRPRVAHAVAGAVAVTRVKRAATKKCAARAGRTRARVATKSLEIIPSPLVKNEEELRERIERIRGLVEWVHYDVMDGVFVPNTTFADPLIVGVHLSSFHVEVHLMVANPLERIASWREEGAERFLIHAESVANLEAVVVEVKSHGAEVGIAVNPDTEISVLIPVISKIDCVVVMGVRPGFSGQSHDPHTADRVRQVRELHATLPIEVDGGVDADTAPALVAAGATRLVTTSYLFGNDDVAGAIQRLKTA